jgi:hypothetical protein
MIHHSRNKWKNNENISFLFQMPPKRKQRVSLSEDEEEEMRPPALTNIQKASIKDKVRRYQNLPDNELDLCERVANCPLPHTHPDIEELKATNPRRYFEAYCSGSGKVKQIDEEFEVLRCANCHIDYVYVTVQWFQCNETYKPTWGIGRTLKRLDELVSFF